MDSTHLTLQAERQARPLCCRYLLVHFLEQSARLWAGSSVTTCQLKWALGTASSGQSEALGCWLRSAEGGTSTEATFDELANRGVQRIGFLAGVHSTVAGASPLSAITLNRESSSCGISAVSASMLSAWQFRIVESSIAQAAQMQFELERSLRRHGPFETTAAACTFVEAALAHLERRFWKDVPARAQRTHRRMQAALRAAAS